MVADFLRTKIVATVGPASANKETLLAFIQSGVRVFRLNFSHGTHDLHQLNLIMIREVAEQAGIEVAVLADLCGPKMRIGKFTDGIVDLRDGQNITLDTRNIVGSTEVIPVQYQQLPKDVAIGNRILLDDGLLELEVLSTEKTTVKARVIRGGKLKDNKGLNLPGSVVSAPSLTEKDLEDIDFILGTDIDFLALSFVRSVRDVLALKEVLHSQARHLPIIAKIEKPQALEDIDAILDAADGIMVARGDLGVEMQPEKVPVIQKDLIRRAKQKSKPVIVATQMLESMTTNPRPTRAEVSDVSNAVFDGADAVMLSAESASGQYPVAAVQMMAKVAHEAESWLINHDQPAPENHQVGKTNQDSTRHAIARSIANLARELPVSVIVVRSKGGKSASFVSATRPLAPVLAVSTDLRAIRKMNLSWGVQPMLVSREDFEDPKSCARKVAMETGLANPKQLILLLAGFGKSEPNLTLLSP